MFDNLFNDKKQTINNLYYLIIFIFLSAFFLLLLEKERFRNDELQHIHTSFLASQGKIPYKDYFDNHTPLYQLLTGFEIKLFNLKPSPDFAVKIRRLSFPLMIILSIILGLMVRTFFTKIKEKSLAISSLVISLIPFVAIQARPEPIWGALFFLSIYLFSFGPPTIKISFLIGLLNGINVCVSLKTLAFIVLPQLLTFPILAIFYPTGSIFMCALTFIIGFLIFPFILLIYFNHLRALNEFFNFGIFYTISTGGEKVNIILITTTIIITLVIVYFFVKRFKEKLSPNSALFFTIFIFSSIIFGFFPVKESQTRFPFLTAFYLLVSVLIVSIIWKFFKNEWLRKIILLSVILSILSVRIITERLFKNNNADYYNELKVLMALQLPGKGTVMDSKGESIFWERPFYYALETFTIRGINSSVIKDTIAESLSQKSTPVVYNKYFFRFTQKDLDFFNENYLPLCNTPSIMVSGKKINTKNFDLEIPLDYQLICYGGKPAIGVLDGRTYRGENIFLSKGKHSFITADKCKEILIIWSSALQTKAMPCGYEEMK